MHAWVWRLWFVIFSIVRPHRVHLFTSDEAPGSAKWHSAQHHPTSEGPAPARRNSPYWQLPCAFASGSSKAKKLEKQWSRESQEEMPRFHALRPWRQQGKTLYGSCFSRTTLQHCTFLLRNHPLPQPLTSATWQKEKQVRQLADTGTKLLDWRLKISHCHLNQQAAACVCVCVW